MEVEGYRIMAGCQSGRDVQTERPDLDPGEFLSPLL